MSAKFDCAIRSQDHYAALGLLPNCTFEEIRAAYKSSIRACHPDVNRSDQAAEEQTRRIIQAYSVLRSVEGRAQYDSIRALRQRAMARGSASLTLQYPVNAPVVQSTPTRRLMRYAAIPLLLIASAIVADEAIQVKEEGLVLTGESLPERVLPPFIDPETRNVVAERSARSGAGTYIQHFINKPVEDAERYSRGCFEAAARTHSAEKFYNCVAFDEAAQAVNAAATQVREGPGSLYFDPLETAARHSLSDDEILAKEDRGALQRVFLAKQAARETLAKSIMTSEFKWAPTVALKVQAEAAAASLPGTVESRSLR